MTRTAKGEDWRRVKAILADALELAPERRSTFLRQACGGDAALRREVGSLLAAYGDTSSLEAPVKASLAAAGAPASTLGPYRIVRRLGRGGTGEVFEAVQESPLRRTVALKLLRPGAESPHRVARFLAELHRRSGEWEAARVKYERALGILEAAFPGEHTSKAHALAGLAAVLRHDGDEAGARRLDDRALAIFTAKLGPDSREAAAILASRRP